MVQSIYGIIKKGCNLIMDNQDKGTNGYALNGWRCFHTAEQLRQKCDEYFMDCDAKDHPYLHVGLCLWLGVSKSTEHSYWRGKYDSPENNFSEILSAARMRIEEEKLRGALTGKYNPFIAKFDLANNHGYTEKTKITGDTDEPVVNKIVLDEKSIGAIVSNILEKY